MKKKNKPLKGAVVCYLNVGHLSVEKTEQLVIKQNEKMKVFIKRLKKQGCEYLTVPVRDQATQLVYMPLP